MKGKKILAMLIAIAMVVALVPATAFAAGETVTFTFSGATASVVGGEKLLTGDKVAVGSQVTLNFLPTTVVGATEMLEEWEATGITLSDKTSESITVTVPETDFTITPKVIDLYSVTAATDSGVVIVTDAAKEMDGVKYFKDETVVTVTRTLTGTEAFGAWANANRVSATNGVDTADLKIATAAVEVDYVAKDSKLMNVTNATIVSVGGRPVNNSSAYVAEGEAVVIRANETATAVVGSWNFEITDGWLNGAAAITDLADYDDMAEITLTAPDATKLAAMNTDVTATLDGTPDAVIIKVSGGKADDAYFTPTAADLDHVVTLTADAKEGQMLTGWTYTNGPASSITVDANNMNKFTIKFANENAKGTVTFTPVYAPAAVINFDPAIITRIQDQDGKDIADGAQVPVGTVLSFRVTDATTASNKTVGAMVTPEDAGTLNLVTAATLSYKYTVAEATDITIAREDVGVLTVAVYDTVISGDLVSQVGTDVVNNGITTRRYTVPNNAAVTIKADEKADMYFTAFKEAGAVVTNTALGTTTAKFDNAADSVSVVYSKTEGMTLVDVTIADGTSTFTQKVESGKIIDLGTPVMEDAKFTEWTLTEGTDSKLDGTKLTVGTTAVTATAVYDKAPEAKEYKVTLSGAGADATGEGTAYKAGDKVTVNAGTLKNSTGVDFTFTKWTSNVAIDAADLTAKEITFTMPASDVVLTATWEGVEYATITFNPGDAEGVMIGEAAATAYTQEMAENVYTVLDANKFTAEGYTFIGWSLTEDVTSIEDILMDGAKVRIYDDMMFYAYWMANEDITADLDITWPSGKNYHGSLEDYIFTIEGIDYSMLISVILGGEDITAYCTYENGSLIITIPSEILEQLPAGASYELRVNTSMGYITHTIEILDATAPETGDNTDVGLWVALAVAALVCGVGSAYLVISKKKVQN